MRQVGYPIRFWRSSTDVNWLEQDSSLHVDLVKRYISRLAELLGDAAARAHLREQGAIRPWIRSCTSTDCSIFAQRTSTASSPPRRLHRRLCSGSSYLGTRPTSRTPCSIGSDSRHCCS